MNKPVSNKSDRLESIEIADGKTDETNRDRDRNIGADTEGSAGPAGAPSGDGNTIRNGDTELPLDTEFDSGE